MNSQTSSQKSMATNKKERREYNGCVQTLDRNEDIPSLPIFKERTVSAVI